MRTPIPIPSQIQLNRIQPHRRGNVDPPPGTPAGIARAQGPADVVPAVGHGKVLQQQARVHGDEHGRREPAEEANQLVGAIRVLERGLLHDGGGAELADGGDDARGAVEDDDAVGQRDDDAGRDGLEGGVEELERRAHGRGQVAQHVEQGRVRRHDDGRERGEVGLRGSGLLGGRRGLGGGLVVGEDLVDGEDGVGKQQGRLHGVTASAGDAEGAQEGDRGHGDADEGGIEIADLREGDDAPQEVDGAGDDGGGEDEEDDLQPKVSHGLDFKAGCTHHPCVTPPAVDEPPCDLASGLDDQQAAEPLEQLEDGARIAQRIVPRPQGYRLDEPLLTKEPLLPGLVVGRGDLREGARHPAGAPRVDREAVEGPDQQRGDDDPL